MQNAANGWFFRGDIAWKGADAQQSSAMLATARNARGPDWKPTGSVPEGNVQQRMFSESGFLTVFEQQWEGSPDPSRAYASLDAYLPACVNETRSMIAGYHGFRANHSLRDPLSDSLAHRRIGTWLAGSCRAAGYPRGYSGPSSRCLLEAGERHRMVNFGVFHEGAPHESGKVIFQHYLRDA